MAKYDVAALSAMQEIRDLMSKYCECVDAFDVEGIVSLFTPDCVLSSRLNADGSGGVRGREALRKLIAEDPNGSRGSRYTHHQLGQIRIDLNGNQARSIAYCIADHERLNGTRTTIRFQYQDRLVNGAEGWKIAERRLLASVCDGEVGIKRTRIPRMHAEGA
jgi:ketosteroid isomerase-like protein